MRRVVLYGLAAEVVGMAAFVAVYNLVQHSRDNRCGVWQSVRRVIKM
jgi:hypothetical protein